MSIFSEKIFIETNLSKDEIKKIILDNTNTEKDCINRMFIWKQFEGIICEYNFIISNSDSYKRTYLVIEGHIEDKLVKVEFRTSNFVLLLLIFVWVIPLYVSIYVIGKSIIIGFLISLILPILASGILYLDYKYDTKVAKSKLNELIKG